MSRTRARVHLDASKPGHRISQALCGYTVVDVESDLTKVTCRLCRKLFAQGDSAPTKRKTAASRGELVGALQDAVAEWLVPKAGSPPKLTPAMWAGSCRGGEHRRCGECEICIWERDAMMWHGVSAWNREHRIQKSEDAPKWSSMNAAILALLEYERHGRASPSAAGGILQRIELGPIDGIARADDPLMRRGAELVAVRQALEVAYPTDGHAKLTSAQCCTLLVMRTPGAMALMPAYDALAAEYKVHEGDVQAVVKHGRVVVEEELLARGLIPRRVPRRAVPEASVWMAVEVVDG